MTPDATEPTAPPPLPLPPPPEPVVPRPGFGRAWLGLWFFTWKSQLAWRRWPVLMATMLAIPLLTYFTIEPLQKLTADYDWRQRPRDLAREFRSEAGELPRSFGTKLAQIIGEEQGRRAPVQPNPATGGALRLSDQALEREVELAEACWRRIVERVRPELDPRQFAAFERFQARKLAEVSGVIRDFKYQELKPYFSWLLTFYFFLALPLYCLFTCGSMIRDELQSDTLGFLTTRPVGRARLFFGKYLSEILWLQIVVALHGLLLLGVGALRQVPGIGALVPLFLLAQVLAVLAWGALSALLGLLTRRYMMLGILYGFVVELGLGRIPTNINTLSITRHLRGLLGHHPLLAQLYDWLPQDATFSVAAVLTATAVFVALAATLFTHREYHPATELRS